MQDEQQFMEQQDEDAQLLSDLCVDQQNKMS